MNKTITTFLAGALIGALGAAYSYHLNHNDIRVYDDAPVMMWNDDWESIPMVGEQIEIEVITQDTIYIGPVGE
jgi:hypothetical protein